MRETQQQTMDPEHCDHEYVEPVDAFSRCCHCEKFVGSAKQPAIPSYWFTHEADLLTSPDIKLARDVLNADFPEKTDSRYIHICGACGHWLTAVHSGYFDRYRGDEDLDTDASFFENLRETLCPDCGTGLFRDGSIVATLESAEKLSASEITNYVLDAANQKFWSGWSEGNYIYRPGRGDDDFVDITTGILEQSLFSHSSKSREYKVRCPACARPASDCQIEFDFHHWDYADDIGCRLCRDCHNHIHRGKTAEEQANVTNDAWEYDAVDRLLALSNRLLEFDNNQQFSNRFNIPRGSTAFEAAQDIF